jgi:hypothetical protein
VVCVYLCVCLCGCVRMCAFLCLPTCVCVCVCVCVCCGQQASMAAVLESQIAQQTTSAHPPDSSVCLHPAHLTHHSLVRLPCP